MKKRVSVLLVACAMIVSMLSSGVQAATPSSAAQDLLTKLRVALQQADQSASASTSVVINNANVLLDELGVAMKNNDSAAMAAAVQKFCSEFSYLDDYNNNNDDYDETKFHQCTTTVAITFASKLPSLYTAITDKHGNTNECLFINITNALADIIGSVYDSEICKVDAYPFDPNATQEYIQQKANLRNGLVQLSQTFHFYSFFATVASTHYCIEEVTAMNYITLLIKFVGIFKYSFFTPVG